MPQLAHGALAAALVLSALGAVLVCLMVVLFGFTGPDDEPPVKTARRLMFTRIGHALATTCFAATAILIAMVLLRSGRATPTAVVHDTRLPAIGERVDQQTSRVVALESRAKEASASVARAERRLQDIEQSLGRLADEGRRTERRVVSLEQSEAHAAAALRASTARKPMAIAPANRTPEPASPSASPRIIPPPTPPPTDRPVSAPVRPASDITPSSPSPGHMPAASVSSTGLPPATPAPSPAAVSVSAPDDETSTSAMPDGLRAKLRQDWVAIQKGFESSRDDVRRAFDVTMRKLREMVQ
jgi:hypothetical protein